MVLHHSLISSWDWRDPCLPLMVWSRCLVSALLDMQLIVHTSTHKVITTCIYFTIFRHVLNLPCSSGLSLSPLSYIVTKQPISLVCPPLVIYFHYRSKPFLPNMHLWALLTVPKQRLAGPQTKCVVLYSLLAI